MNKEYTQFGYKENTKEIFHISKVENGNKCNCVCISCGAQLTAKQGKIKIHHFAHRKETNCVGSHETLLHLLTKEVIQEQKSIYLPKLKIESNKLTHIHIKRKIFFNENFDLYNIKVEKKEGEIQPDLGCDVLYNNKKHKIFIEVGVTHFVEEEKKEYLKNNNINCIEINLKDLYKKIKILNIEDLKEEIKDYLKRYSKDNIKWINQNIINKTEEVAILNKEIKKRYYEISKKVIDSINEDTIFNYQFDNKYITLEKNNFFGKYTRYISLGELKKFKIKKIINKDYKKNEIKVIIECFGEDKEFYLLINKGFYKEKKENVIYINNFRYMEELIKRFDKNKNFKEMIENVTVNLSEGDFYNEEKVLSNYTPQKELERYKNFIRSIKNKKIRFPNPVFEKVELDLENKKCLFIPDNLKKDNVEVLIKKVEIPDKKSPNILKLYYNRNDYFYLIFSSDELSVKELEIYKNRYKNKKSILFYKFNGNTSFNEFKDFDWTKDENKFIWFYHKGFENLKSNFIKVSKLDFKIGNKIFYLKYGYKLKNIRNKLLYK